MERLRAKNSKDYEFGREMACHWKNQLNKCENTKYLEDCVQFCGYLIYFPPECLNGGRCFKKKIIAEILKDWLQFISND